MDGIGILMFAGKMPSSLKTLWGGRVLFNLASDWCVSIWWQQWEPGPAHKMVHKISVPILHHKITSTSKSLSLTHCMHHKIPFFCAQVQARCQHVGVFEIESKSCCAEWSCYELKYRQIQPENWVCQMGKQSSRQGWLPKPREDIVTIP